MATLQQQFEQRQRESAGKINDLYNKQYETQANSLKTAYDQNLSDKQAALGKIAPQYQTQANTMAQNYERQRRNANLGAMANGLNTGAAQQQQLAMNQKWLQNYGALRGEEASAINTANQDIAKLTTEYNNALAKARSDVDAKREQALVEDYNKQREWYDTQANTLAQYGNFDAYKDLYGEAQAKQMRSAWIAQNPDAAFRSGMISKADYKKLTGKDPQYQSIYA